MKAHLKQIGHILIATVLTVSVGATYAHGGSDGDRDDAKVECPCDVDVKQIIKTFKDNLPGGTFLFGNCNIQDRVLINQGGKINTVVTNRTSFAEVNLYQRSNENNFYGFDGNNPYKQAGSPNYTDIGMTASWNPQGNASSSACEVRAYRPGEIITPATEQITTRDQYLACVNKIRQFADKFNLACPRE